MIDLKKLKSKENQEYYTTKDIVVPAGTRIENWSTQQKEDHNRFEMIVGVGKDSHINIPLYPADLEDIIINNPGLISKENPLYQRNSQS